MGHYYTLQIWILLLLDITQISDAFSVGILTKTKQHHHHHHHRTAPLALSEQEDGGGIGVGIDLGTTNSAVAFLDGDTPCIIEIPNNGRTMSSVVAFDGDDDGSSLVGAAAIDWERNKHQSAYRHVKRIIGTGADFVPSEILDVVPHVVAIPHLEEESSSSSKSSKKKKKKTKTKKPSLQRIIDNAKDNPTMLASLDVKKNALVSPESISATILEKLLDVATEHTKKQITRAVIGVPAYFNDAQREATIRAANQAGIEKVKLLREPEAAALAYGVDKGSENEELVLVFDLGGGTYDVSILLVEKGLTEIVCTSGNSQLGGSNFDSKLAKHLSSILGNCCRSELCQDTMLLAAEQIRIYLSNNRVAQLALPLKDQGWIELDSPKQVIISKSNDLFETNTRNETHLFYEISRKEMEKLCLEELQLLLRPIREVAIMAGALLPGDARPSIVESSLEIEGAFSEDELFYKDETDDVDSSTQEVIKSAVEEIDYKATKSNSFIWINSLLRCTSCQGC